MTWLGWLLVGAAVGWLIGMLLDWFWWRDRRICTDDEIRLRKEVGDLEGRVAGFDKERADWNTRLSGMDSDLAESRSRIGNLESENTALTGKVGEFDKERANWQARASELDSYKTKVSGLESENATLRGQVGDYEGKIGDLNTRLSSAETRLKAPKPSVQTAGLAAGGAAAVAATAAAASGATKKVEPPVVEAAAEVEVEGDDLQKLWGIGPASERVLNENGIHTYDQLCKSDPADLRAMLDASSGTFNLVREDTWPEQACLAHAERWPELTSMQDGITEEYVSSEFTGEYTGERDDLTKLWGIGPAVEKVLHSKGVFRFDQLAGMPMKMLQGIITAAGDRFKLVKPELWIPQAKVAATGDMKALEVLKKQISAKAKS